MLLSLKGRLANMDESQIRNLRARDVVPRVVLTIVTCGIFGLYWIYTLTRDIHELSGKPQTGSPIQAVIFSVLTCGLYFLYWVYKISGELVETRREMGLALDPVEKSMYAIVIVIMTFMATGFSILESVVDTIAGAEGTNVTEEELFILIIAVLFGAGMLYFFVNCIISAVILYVVYKRKDPNPRILYMLMVIFRTNFLTVAFIQASLNDAIYHRNNPGICTGAIANSVEQ